MSAAAADAANALEEIALTVGSSLELGAVLERVVDVTAEAIGGAEVGLYLYEDDARCLSLAAATTDVAAEHVGVARVALGEGIVGWVAAARTAYAVGGRLPAAPAGDDRPQLGGDRSDGLVCVPLLANDRRLVGVVAAWARRGRPFAADGLELAERIAALVAGAIEHARLHAAAATAARAVERVAEVAAITTAGVATVRVLDVVAELTCDIGRAEVAVMLVADPSGGDLLTIRTADPGDDELRRRRLVAVRRELSAIEEEVRRGGSTWHAAAEQIGRRLRPWLRSVATLPLRVAGEELGVICCYGPEGQRCAGADQMLLATIAGQAALALKNAALAAEVLERQNEFGHFVRDLTVGRLDAGATRAQASALGFDPGRRHCFVVGSIAGEPHHRDAERRALVLRQIAHILGELSSDARCIAGARDAVALLTAHDGDAWLAELRSRLASLRGAVHERTGALVTFGIAQGACTPEDLRRALMEAREVVALGAAADGVSGVFTLDDVSHQLLLRRAADVATAGDRYSSAMETLAEYDRVNGSALLETLGVFLHVRSRSDAARALYVHRNTLAQRLRRIEELTRVPISDADEWFPLQLALKIHELRNPGGRTT